MSTKKQPGMRQVAWAVTKYCLPLLAASAVLIFLVGRQGVRFRISDAGPRLNGTYQIILQANAMLDKDAKPKVTLSPAAETDTLVQGNRLTVITKQPLLTGTPYTIQISEAVTTMGNRQSRPSTLSFTTKPAAAYGIHRTGGDDRIDAITIANNQLASKPLLSARRITMLGVSPDYVWFTSAQEDRSHTLRVYDKKSRQISDMPLPGPSIVEALSVAKETNQAAVVISSTQANTDGSLQDEHTVYLASADQKSVAKQPPPIDTAAAVLFSPDGSVILTQGRDGSVYAKSLSMDEATPLGRTRLAGPFSGNGTTLLLRAIDNTAAYRLETAQREIISTIPVHAAQVLSDFGGRQFVYAATEFVQNQSGQVRVYTVNMEGPPKKLHDVPSGKYSGRLGGLPTFQFVTLEQFPKDARFDDYTGNSKAGGTETAFIGADGKTLGTLPLIDVQWE